MAPEQIRVLPVNNAFHLEKSNEIVNKLKQLGIRASLDASEDKLGYRLRNAQVNKVPYTLVIGDNEVANNTVTYRHFGSRKQITVTVDEFIEMITKEIKNRELPKKEEEEK